jgi:hypothetical protein
MIFLLDNYNNITLNFYNILINSDSIHIKNCDNLTLIIDSKINKITIEKSNKIFININKLINGFEISKSTFVFISSNHIPFIDIYKTNLYLIGNINKYSNTKIKYDNSNLYYIN